MVKVTNGCYKSAYEDLKLVLPRLKPNGEIEKEHKLVRFSSGRRSTRANYDTTDANFPKGHKRCQKSKCIPLLTIRTKQHKRMQLCKSGTGDTCTDRNCKRYSVKLTEFNRDIDDYIAAITQNVHTISGIRHAVRDAFVLHDTALIVLIPEIHFRKRLLTLTPKP